MYIDKIYLLFKVKTVRSQLAQIKIFNRISNLKTRLNSFIFKGGFKIKISAFPPKYYKDLLRILYAEKVNTYILKYILFKSFNL